MKQTEDLLAGFDRTGRTPKTPATRDFVDYHRQPQPRVVTTPRIASPTYVIRRGDRTVPGWLAWVGAGLAMLGGGALVAYLVTRSSPPPPTLHFTPQPASATASAPAVTAARLEEPVPLPDPEPTTEPAPAASTAAPAPTPSARPKAPPRSDFARSL